MTQGETEGSDTTSSARGTKTGRIHAYLTDLIDGSMSPHDKLPTERELANRLGVNRATVRAALDRLTKDGLVERIQGSGTYVAERPIVKTLELTSFTDDMAARGLHAGSEVLSTEEIEADAHLSAALQVSPGATVHHIKRVRTADGVPMALEETNFVADKLPGLLDEQLTQPLYALIHDKYGIAIEAARQSIRATVLDPEEAKWLHCAPYSPALHVRRTSVDAQGVPIEYATSLYRGDRYEFEVDLSRSGRDQRA
jgi:GntR family transcriptional regulator